MVVEIHNQEGDSDDDEDEQNKRQKDGNEKLTKSEARARLAVKSRGHFVNTPGWKVTRRLS
jgi:hypothetical protein